MCCRGEGWGGITQGLKGEVRAAWKLADSQAGGEGGCLYGTRRGEA